METQDRDREFERIVDELVGRYSREEVAGVVADSRSRLEETATVGTYLPVLAQRFATERLRSLAKARGGPAKGVTHLLFVCNGNAGRSQMAAAFAAALGSEAVVASSAGLNPLQEVLPDVRAAMQEKGVGLPEAYPKPVTDDVFAAADVVIGLGVAEGDLPQARQRTLWDIPPVVDRGPAEVRAARDDIEARVRSLLSDLADDGTLNHSSGGGHASR
ncbi:low molecular weight phosphatase family protein [Janibacter anophelis]|uniref:arsenate-mycothiol transferase ArsC n=1 Tax=Janibacter anophelis TaxID=319054 RepID=UPI0013B06BFC|nr:arsenate reductase ArsC [Janibacter anophelis]